ncbi:MAG TPA: flagellar basal-body MS-ring/collar protein FliF [Stellaceae bacterium]|nr:flagellar basal-body MS-ring/collar protein FliF [Stellaceae bacterium]
MASLDLAAILSRSVWDRLAPVWNGKWRAALLAGAGLLVAIVAVALLWSWDSSYSVLFAGLSGEEGGRAVTELQKLNIPYRIAEGGRVILVPTAEVGRARLELAVRGVPKAEGGEWALLDNERLGVSPFVEQVDYVRALETALARTIRQVDGVVSAQVKLALPKETDFLANSPKPSASVMLRLRPGLQLTTAQIDGIAGFVAASIPGLARDQVTVIDQSGRVLNPDSKDGLDQVPRQLAIARDIERRYEAAITDLLAPVLGRGNFRVSVDADLDFSKAKEGSIVYGDGHVLSQDEAIHPQSADEAPAIGIPGALSNRPPATPVTAPASRPNRGRQARMPIPARKPEPPPPDQHRTTNYDVDRTMHYIERPVWSVHALHVAVLVNDPSGKPMPAERLKSIDTLVRSVIGAGANRLVAVVDLPFQSAGAAAGPAAMSWWDEPWAAAVTHDIGLALAGLLVLFGGVLPVLSRLRASPAADLEATASPLAATPVPLGGMARGQAIEPYGPQYGRDIDAETVRTLAANDPARTAQVIKEWIARDRNRLRQAG